MKKRGFPRKPKVVQIDITSQVGVSTGNTLNISPGGMGIRLHGQRQFKPGEKVLLEARSHGRIYQMEGLVVWHESNDAGSILGVQLEMDGSGFMHDALNDTGEIVEPESTMLRVIYLSSEDLLKDWTEDVRYGRVRVGLLPPHPEPETIVMVHFSIQNQGWEVMAKGLVTSCEIDGFQVLLDEPEQLRADLVKAIPEMNLPLETA